VLKESIGIDRVTVAVLFGAAASGRAARSHRADGLILFNRFYQPDIDPLALETVPQHLSDSSELLLRLRWLAIPDGCVARWRSAAVSSRSTP
jgi:dihydroorotate dehydrogenase (fumarate)